MQLKDWLKTLVGMGLLGLGANVRAAPGDLDCSFGNAGTRNLDFGTIEAAYAVARQSDGRLVTIGSDSAGKLRLTRFLPGGTLDPTFANGGTVVHEFAGLGFTGDIAVDSQDRILVAGRITIGDQDAFVARFTPTGQADGSFGGGDGWVNFDFSAASDGSGAEFATAIAINADDRALIAGVQTVAGNGNATLARLTLAGELDGSFGGGDGRLDFGAAGGSQDDARALVIDSLGRAVLTGSTATTQASNRNTLITRVTIGGVLDSSFDGDGIRVLDLAETGGDDFGHHLAVIANDELLVLGYAINQIGLARLQENGALNTSLASDGILHSSFSGGQNVLERVLVQNDGRILITGWPPGGNGFFIFASKRFLANGEVDTSWGVGGLVTTNIQFHNRAYDALLLPDQRLLLAGGLGSDTNMGIARFLNDGHANANTSVQIIADTPENSVRGGGVNVSVQVNDLNALSPPSGRVVISDDADACVASLSPNGASTAIGSCELVMNTAGSRTISAQYDGALGFCRAAATEPHTVIRTPTTLVITSHSPDPSLRLAPVTVSFALTPALAQGTPTGNVMVSDGQVSCTVPLATGQCTLNPTSAGTRQLTATFVGDSQFAPSTSPGVGHTVQVVVSAGAGANGQIQPSGQVGVNAGSSASFQLLPDPGYRIAAVDGCGGSLIDDQYTIAPASNDCAISASFERIPEADLEVAINDDSTGIVPGQTTSYRIVVANAGPDAVTGAHLTNTLSANLTSTGWTCRQDLSSASCPQPSSGTGAIDLLLDLTVGQALRFDQIAIVAAAATTPVTNSVSIQAPAGTTALDTSDDAATDSNVLLPDGLFVDGFESGTRLSLPAAHAALQAE